MDIKKYLFAACLSLAFLFTNAQKLYIAENGAQHIQRSNLDGTTLELLSSAGQVGSIRDIVIDEFENEVYWIENDASFARVKRAKMNPIAPSIGIQLTNEEDFIRVASGFPVPANQFEGLAIDPANRNLYITNQARIERISLDAAAPITVLPAAIVTGLFQTYGIDVDQVNDRVYFVNQATSRQIQRMNLNGTGVTIIVNDFSQGTIHDVVVEPTGGNLYFSTVTGGGVGEVRKTDLLGTSPFAIVTSQPTSIRGVAVDAAGGNIYWATGGANVGRASLTGTGATNIVTGLNNAFYVTIDLRNPLADKMYWSEEVGNYINRANRDGSDIEEYYTGFANFPQGVAYDYVNDYIYWSNTNGQIIRGQIGEGDFFARDILIDQSSGSARANMGISLDIDGGKMYWASNWDGSIKVADFNDPSPITTMQQIVTGLSNPRSVAVDVGSGKIYYTENVNAGDNLAELHQANLDGSGDIIVYSEQISGIDFFFTDIKLDLANGKIYWSGGQDDDDEGEDFGAIYSADLPNITGTVTSFDTNIAGEPWGIDLDVDNNYVYWISRGFDFPDPPVFLTPAIFRAELDGSNPVELVNDDFIGSSYFIALNVVPTPPVCSVVPTANAGSDLSVCPGESVSLSGTIGGSATNPVWASSGDGTFDDNSSLVAVYTPGAADISGGSVTLSLTVDGSGSCPQASDQVVVLVTQNPVAATLSLSANVQQITNTDVITPSTVGVGDMITVTIIANGTKGNATVETNNTISYTPNAGTVGADSYQYRICNQCNLCSDATVSVDIVNEAPQFVQPTTPPTVVAGQSLSISIAALLNDVNNNLDLSSFTNFTSAFNASFTYDPVPGNLTIDYSTATINGLVDDVGFTICDQLNACTNVSLQIEIDGEIVAYNGVSPNGDGLNDFFEIRNIQFLGPQNNVTIFNRWGDKVFEIEDYDNDNPDRRFNGVSDNGKDLPSGIYFYRIEFVSGRSSLEGYLTLKR
ncbi:MAG: gliding motility-associated C-terminal domain-containing protein [Cyclobacteriaceae bacterium]